MKYQPYRDEPFQRDCEDRYKVIKKFLDQFKRQFSVLDIGANYGWFGQRLVRDFDCVYVGIDNKTIDPHERIWHINRHVSAKELGALSRSESFDIVLGLSVLHHFKDYERAWNAMKRLGHWVFVEIPGPEDENAVGNDRHKGIAKIFCNAKPIAGFKSHVSDTMRPMYLWTGEPFIVEQSLDAADRGALGYANYTLYSDFRQSLIEIDRCPIIPRREIRYFIPGMNAHNFRLLGGEVEIPETNHPDNHPWNYIIGDGVKSIDTFHIKRD